MTETSTILVSLLIALGLGLLVGVERERSASPIAGVRTFALVTVLGTVCGLLAVELGGWIVALGLAALAALTVAANLMQSRGEAVDPGQTTEVALLLMFAVGAYLAVGSRPVAVVLGGAVAVLLHMKERLHQWAGRISERDYRAMMRFALISLVILPVLPNRAYDPWGVLDPREIWWMVVLIVGIGLAAYLGRKLLGERAGTLVAGLLGGAVSSTATTVSQARRSRQVDEDGGTVADGSVARTGGAAGASAAIIALASAVVLVRMLVEIAVVAPGFLAAAAVPLGVLLAVLAALALLLWLTATRDGTEVDEPGNPAELRPALLFAALYAAVLVAVAVAERYLGAGGIYAVAALSGLTDADAITLSTSRLVREGALVPEVARRALVIAAMANLVFKGGAVAVLGSRQLLVRVAAVYAAALAAGAVLLLWL